MKLSEEEAILFFELWTGLLAYVNRKHHVNPDLKEISPKANLPPQKIYKVVDWVWDHPEEIDFYLSENHNLPEKHRALIFEWKHFVRGNFIVERHLKKGSILISTDPCKVYLAKGITDTWESLLRREPCPVIISTTLIPFCGTIISDGIVYPYDVIIGNGMKRELKNIYLNAKMNEEIIQVL